MTFTRTPLPFAVTFHFATPTQAANFAEHFHHHGQLSYLEEGQQDNHVQSEHYVDRFDYDAEGNHFYAEPRQLKSLWEKEQEQQLRKSDAAPEPDQQF